MISSINLLIKFFELCFYLVQSFFLVPVKINLVQGENINGL